MDTRRAPTVIRARLATARRTLGWAIEIGGLALLPQHAWRISEELQSEKRLLSHA